MARKLRIGVAPTGIPKHTIKINGKNIGIEEDYVSVKAYGRSVFVNERFVYEATRDVIRVSLPRDVRLGRVKAVQGSWLSVGEF